MKRDLSDFENVILDELYAAKAAYKQTHAYVTTTRELPMTHWNGLHPVDANQTTKTIPTGSTLKIVMVSRFGDVGLTDDLDAVHGYGLRMEPDDDALTNLRRAP